MPATPTPYPRPLRRRGNARFRKIHVSTNYPQAKRRGRLAAKRRVGLLGPFGEPLTTPAGVAAEMPFRFSTKYQDAETGLYYYGYRYYDPITGRWLNRDPIGERGGLNLHAFLRNNATGNVDYLGLFPTPGKFHGKYCGANRVNGQNMSQDGLTPEQIGPDGGGPPGDDAADRCCIVHDKCFARAALLATSDDDKKRERKTCDSQLMICWSKSLCSTDVKLIDKLKTIVGIPVFFVAHPSPPARDDKCCGTVLFRLQF